MSAPFTPGPWGVFDDEERFVVAVGQIGEDTICEPLGDTPGQAVANGYLIAAAPDLYAALSELVMTSYPSPQWQEVCGRAVIALAKARGQ